MGKKKPSTDLAPQPQPGTKQVVTVSNMRDAVALDQVIAATSIPHGTGLTRESTIESSVELYKDFRAKDPIDSLLARLMVALGNVTMNAFGQSIRTKFLAERELELKMAMKGSLVLAELAKSYDARRDRGKQTVNVGHVNVESGAQAIVGNVTPAARPGAGPHPVSAAQDGNEMRGNTTFEKKGDEPAKENSPSEQEEIESADSPKN